MNKAKVHEFLVYLKETAVSYEVNPKDHKTIWRTKLIFNKFYDCLTKTEKRTHKEDLKYIRECFINAYREAYEKERMFRDKVEDLEVELDMIKAVDVMKNNEI